MGWRPSPPCLAADIAPGYFDPLAVDPEQACGVARWRGSERTRLLDARKGMSADARRAGAEAIADHLRDVIGGRIASADTAAAIVSFYWPIKGEPDLRALMAALHEEGVMVALRVVERRQAPLVFRRWTPEIRMKLGHWSIPVPPPESSALKPTIVIAPLVGWDAEGFRLGYGGGYFDRTLAVASPAPFKIGVGFQSARLTTIFPQHHDIPFDLIVTEVGVEVGGAAL